MSAERDPATVAGPEPRRQSYRDGSHGSEEQSARPDGTENVGSAYNPGSVRPTGNLILGIVVLIALALLVGVYVVAVAMR